MSSWQGFSGINSAYVLEQYERYLSNPASVDADTRALFASWTPPADDAAPSSGPGPNLRKALAAVELAQAIRRLGHLGAQLDPLGTSPQGDPALLASNYGLTDDDLRALPASLLESPLAAAGGTMFDVVQRLRAVYCGSIGHDYAHVFDPQERQWLTHAVEQGRFRAPVSPVDAPALLDRLTQVEAFERFLHRAFQAKTRFSLEGLDMMVPMLDEVIGGAVQAGVETVVVGMAHRGRLNVMAHVLDKPYAQILAEFKDPLTADNFREDMWWMSDVKYHAGGLRSIPNDGRSVSVVMPPNPSHLEAVDPVVVGMARAAATQASAPGAPVVQTRRALPIVIHGDAAFPGQGVVAESLNLARLAGYDTGGTVHLIVNNKLGFTANSPESFSTSYCSGLARAYEVPILHVNADDPEACVEAARLAIAYRNQFQRDVLIDLVGYRRYGHNEGDEPGYTQPLTYKAIASHPTVRDQWVQRLIARGVTTPDAAAALAQRYADQLQGVLDALKPEQDLCEPVPAVPPAGLAAKATTGVSLKTLAAINAALLQLPDGFSVHPKLVKGRERRAQAFAKAGERTVDWATAEDLAFATILADGTPIRLTGEDAQRGTFSHRHAVLHDPNTDARHVPLHALPQAKASIEIINSPLTENATIGFEFGYNVQAPERLVIWEAQYGDFINGAQTMLDEFVVSARTKWGQTPSLVLLLPHAHEGAGPDHASARPERFLQLAADMNMRVVNCTSAAQYFHLLRRQAALLTSDPLPLVVLTPKGLLRHPMMASTPDELATGSFRRLIDDADAKARAKEIRRVVLCTGKIYVDLASSDKRAAATTTAICRIEQLYPLSEIELAAMLDGYAQAEEILWVQEEPENYGYWDHLRDTLVRAAKGRPVRLIARPRSASPAEGTASRHARHQARILEAALQAAAPAPAATAKSATTTGAPTKRAAK